jgi:hypothetical protein
MLDYCFGFYAFHMDPDARMSSPDKLCSFINQLREQGYDLVDNYEQEPTDSNNIIREPAQITASILAKYRSGSRMIGETFWKDPLEFDFSLDHVNGQLWIFTTLSYPLTGPDHDLGKRIALEILKVLRKSLKAYPPYFGCANKIAPDLSFADIDLDFKAADIYDINFYSAVYLDQHLDREPLLTAPAWCVEAIANGMLLVPSLQGIYTNDEESLDAVRQHLGWTKPVA